MDQPKPDCIFCQIAQRLKTAEIISEHQHCFVIKDQFPVTKGHLLIIPYQHIEMWFTANPEIQQDMLLALNQSKDFLDTTFHPAGYNIGLNCGKAAGQTVMHLHMHLIPRYDGDVIDPRGGVRGVVPDKQKY
jgi:diadenosine tetraphosphate (Ap4A) HIT family hydrolase